MTRGAQTEREEQVQGILVAAMARALAIQSQVACHLDAWAIFRCC